MGAILGLPERKHYYVIEWRPDPKRGWLRYSEEIKDEKIAILRYDTVVNSDRYHSFRLIFTRVNVLPPHYHQACIRAKTGFYHSHLSYSLYVAQNGWP